MANPFTLTLTLDEGQTLINLLDTAVKSAGLPIAGVASNLAGKIQEAANAPDPVSPVAEEKPE